MTLTLERHGRTRVRQALITLAMALASASPQAADTGLALSAHEALVTRDKCQMLMHEDAVEFQRCADAVLLQSPVRTESQRYARLGRAYYAWLASTAAAKNGLPASQAAALHFLRMVRPLQHRLGVDDASLCATIPGDCTQRTARMRIMDKEAGLR